MGDESKYRISLRGRIFRALMGLRCLSPEGMAEYARANTAFYEKFYEGHATYDFDNLPVLHKKAIKNVSPYDLLSRPFRDKVVLYAESTGSSGSPTPSFLTELEFKAAAMMARMSPYSSMMKEIFRENRTCINGLAMEFTIAGLSFMDLLKSLGGLVANVGSRSTLGTPERIARAIARLKPAIIACMPVDFLSWMRIVKEDYPGEYPEVLRNLKGLVSTAELCAGSRRRAIEKEFGITHVDTYACVEGFFTIPCPCGEKHIPDIYHTELFDSRMNPLPKYGRGRICFTNLAKKSSPLVRYLLDDTVTISRSSCPHGFRTGIVPHGRYELGVSIGGTSLNVEDFEQEIFKHGLFGGYEVKISDKSLTVTLEKYSDARVPIKAISEGLAAKFGLHATVKPVRFGTITRYREVRDKKPLLRLIDGRKSSTQNIPEYL